MTDPGINTGINTGTNLMTGSSGNGPDAVFDVAAAQALLDEVTAPWVRALGLRVVEIGPARSRFHLPFGEALTRDAGMICGQAIVAAADTAMIAVIMVDVWKTTPFMALLILAGLQMLPTDCYESARVDGIPPWKVFLRVTLPLVYPAIAVAVIFRALDALRIFDLIYVLTSNSADTMTMSVYARQQLVDFQDVGYGSAASTALFLIIAGLTIIYIVFGKVDLSGEKSS